MRKAAGLLAATIAVGAALLGAGAAEAASPGPFYLQTGLSPHRVLDANPASVHENRGDVYQWTYNGTIAQKWYYFSDLTIRPAADPQMCLDANPHTPFNGGEVYLWKCGNNTAQQKWTRVGNSGLRSNYSGLCLDVDTSTNFDGGKVQQWSCNGKPQQAWFFHNA